jgi:hypothetical protein
MEHVAVLAARADREATGRPAVDKRMTAEAATALIRDGDHVAIGGTLYSRTPMALVFALLRHRRRHLTVSRPLACYEIELFLSTGMLDRIITSWVGIGLPWGLPPSSGTTSRAGRPATTSGATWPWGCATRPARWACRSCPA